MSNPETVSLKSNSVTKSGQQQWSSQLDFIMTNLAYAVGLGNLWRFPYLVYKNNGLTFLIPYFICFFSLGLPLAMIEGLFGQFHSKDAIKIWNIMPTFKGLGWGQSLLNFLCCVYYTIIIGYASIYLYESLPLSGFTLPWSETSDFCVNNNQSILDSGYSCAEYFYNNEILKDTGDFSSGLSQLNYKIAFFTFLCWVIIYLSQFSINATGKFSYFTAITPYVCLTALFCVAITLPGASVGLRKYTFIDWSKLFKFSVWIEAASQIFFSQGVAWGVLINFGSHNNFRCDVFNLSWKISVGNVLTSLYGGIVIFSTLGFLALEKFGDPDVAFERFGEVVGQTHKLAFVVYPIAISKMPFPWLWAILFFLMLTMLGFGSSIGMVLCSYEGWLASLPKRSYFKKNPKIFLGICTLICYLFGYCIMTNSGIKWLGVWNDTMCTFSITIFCILELYAISWVYGIDTFMTDVENMLQYQLPFRSVLKYLWSVVSPLFACILLMVNVVFVFKCRGGQGGCTVDDIVDDAGNLSKQIIWNWPWYAELNGWLIQIVQLAPVIFFAIKHFGDRNAVYNAYEHRDRCLALEAEKA